MKNRRVTRRRLGRVTGLFVCLVALPTCTFIWGADDYTFDAGSCTIASDCAAPALPCQTAVCTEGRCALADVPEGADAPPASQTASDCLRVVCDGAGNELETADESDVVDDDNPCTENLCTNGAPENPPSPEGTLCPTGACDGAGMCLPSTCGSGVLDGDETDVDCGGSCAGCDDGQACAMGTDCQSLVCADDFCQTRTCLDDIENGDETDVDCGGSCPPCPDDAECLVNEDCESKICDGTCAAPSCLDLTQNGDETDVDCGGTSGCATCDNGLTCATPGDCTSTFCVLEQCVPVTCTNGSPDTGETDTDCGGPDCAPCADGDACVSPGDCQSGVCGGTTCQSAGCVDTILNGDETDVDCGGSCDPCDTGETCMIDGDCESTVCLFDSCQKLHECERSSATDLTGQANVTIDFANVGNNYVPPCARISAGTTVLFQGNFNPHPLEGGKVVQGTIYPDPTSPFFPATTSGSNKSFLLDQVGALPYYCITHAAGSMYGVLYVE